MLHHITSEASLSNALIVFFNIHVWLLYYLQNLFGVTKYLYLIKMYWGRIVNLLFILWNKHQNLAYIWI